MSQPSTPEPPNAAQDYGAGIQTFLKYLPKMLNAEYRSRQRFDPKYIEQQQRFQDLYGPKQYEQALLGLRTLDPWGQANRAALGKAVLGDLQRGYELDPKFSQQLQSEIRGAQAARGNVAGSAGISGETLYQGRAAQNMYQQRLQNVGNFLQLRTPEADLAFVPQVQAPDQFRIVNPNSGYLGQQIGQQGYQNQLAAYSLGNQGGGGAGWGQLAGSVIGGAVGGYFGGPAGAQAGVAGGGAIGGTVGGYFSSKKVKENIEDTGKRTRDGIPRVTFNYIGDSTRYEGVLAEDVLRVNPEAVFSHKGILAVNYDMIGEKMEAI